MAIIEYYIGNHGPYFADDTDPSFTSDNQLARRVEITGSAETTTTLGALIGGAGNATPNDSDFVATSLTAGGVLKKITWTNVKAFLKAYYDGLYVPITATISLTAQVAALGAAAITGTNTTGLYRVSYYLEDTTADLTAGTIMVNFAYTDDGGSTTISSVALPLTAVGRTQGTLFIRVLGTGSISYSTTLVGIIGTSQYALFVTVEKLL